MILMYEDYAELGGDGSRNESPETGIIIREDGLIASRLSRALHCGGESEKDWYLYPARRQIMYRRRWRHSKNTPVSNTQIRMWPRGSHERGTVDPQKWNSLQGETV